MSKTQIIDGVEYIQKDHVDEIVRQRIQKYSEKLAQTESKIQEYEAKLDEAKSKMGLVDQLSSQLESLQGELTNANSRYERHTTISKFGINDGDVRDMVEWQYERAMSNIAKKDRVSLGEWLETIKTDPTLAPSTLRPFFETKQTEQTTEQLTPGTPTTPTTTPMTPPSSNRGVQSQAATTPNDLLSRATDPSFYSQNRDAIREAFYARLGQTPHKF